MSNFGHVVKYKTIWLSDIHLGTRGCKAAYLLDFLKHHEAETIYLVGDIIDGWRLKKSWYWPQTHNDVVQKLLRQARKGVKVIYVPGNHDEFARDFEDLSFGGIAVVREATHTLADGRQLLILHGDKFDGVMHYARWLAYLGDWAYETLLSINTFVNVLRSAYGLEYWSLSAYLKNKVKNAVSFVSNYERVVARAARDASVDGVVCGHIHKSELRYIDDVLYCNTGDWVESCTALVEDDSGKLSVIQWTTAGTQLFSESR
ncbi:MAG: UDP-2,3-diacylglucosamine diphosphatase [Oceanospirillales bacterium TMED33]|nr:UDP-2,3-diacylglucosamine hydrolase [Gammaproteobacteria bacterium]RPG19436.1 MAG: UDP-2,3-diacylglucosamine diphosphatase [Oceanospirillales bacterium TMED33]CAI8320531.1 MAG: UDP-2,3-diacylglucosamine hydrolase [Gammaproteobacteria bacterium]